MANLIVLNKPFRVLSQFTSQDDKRTLAEFGLPAGYYAAGRLDWDSEGLLLLTNNGPLQARLSSPKFHLPKTYWVQVEGCPDEAALAKLRRGVKLKDGTTRPAGAKVIAAPALWPRQPPIRQRNTVADSWIALTLTEGRNRQVRRMTAAVGFPTLRLVRAKIGDWDVTQLQPGGWYTTQVHLPKSATKKHRQPTRKRRQ